MGRVALLALHATEQATAQAGLEAELLSSGRTGIAYGSTSGSSIELEAFSRPLMNTNSMRGLESNAYLRIMAHTCAANLASHFRVRGRVQPTCSACTSGSQAVGVGYEVIKRGTADVMICGGAEEMHYTTAVTFDLLMATSVHFNDTPEASPRPFDRGRDGLIVGEAAATLVLEELEHAKKRGATIHAEVLGYASNCDGGHITQPDPEGMRRVMMLSLEDAGVSPDQIDYVNAHATGTPIGDVAEARATWSVFERAVPISSQKGHVGHTLGACGTLEAIWTVEMMRRGFFAPTRNLTEVDPECPALDFVQEIREAKAKIAMSNNFAFGGVNTSIVLGLAP
jgi:3-oxoacyl-[acyl-carrier-protein] synthase II